MTGGSVSGPGDEVEPAVAAQSAAKLEMAQAYVDAISGDGSVAELKDQVTSYEATYGLQEEMPAIDALVAGGDASSNAVASTNAYVIRILSVPYYSQNTGYYCGPAVGRMILDYKNAGRSAYDNSVQSQANIANANHMNTTTAGTPWDKGRFRVGMNRWLSGKTDGWYVNNDSPSPSEMKSMLISDINNSYPLGLNTVEFVNDYHYNNHPD